MVTKRSPILPALVAAGALLLTGCGPTSFLITPVPGNRDLQETVIQREALLAMSKIALIEVDGMIANADEPALLGPGGDNPVALLKERLDKAAGDRAVKAVVLRINSPGGTVTGSELMYELLRDFREQTGKPIVASMLDVAASGGYYIACAADEIYALPTTVTGSIGVIIILPQVTGTMSKLGIEAHVFKSGKYKDSGSPFREMEPQDAAVFDGLIDDMYARFVAVVKAGRPGLANADLSEIANGRVFFATDALELGLVDAIGTVDDAFLAAKRAAGLEEKSVVVVRYVRPAGYRPNVYADAPPATPQVNLINLPMPWWLSGPAPRFMYIWSPGL